MELSPHTDRSGRRDPENSDARYEEDMKQEVAREISALMLDTTERLDRSVTKMRTQLPPAEFGTYGRAVGTILADIIMEVLDPLYAEHPDLKPPEMP